MEECCRPRTDRSDLWISLIAWRIRAGRKLSLTLQWVSWISSCWNMYAVTKQNNSDISGKPTVARHSLRNDRTRCTELLLLPTLFSSILAGPLSILAFVREADGVRGSSNSGSRSDDDATRTHAAPRSLDGPRRRSAYHGIPLGQREESRINTSRPWITRSGEIARWLRRNRHPGRREYGGEGDPNCERGRARLVSRALRNLPRWIRAAAAAAEPIIADLSRSFTEREEGKGGLPESTRRGGGGTSSRGAPGRHGEITAGNVRGESPPRCADNLIDRAPLIAPVPFRVPRVPARLIDK